MSDWETDCEDWAEFYKRHPHEEVGAWPSMVLGKGAEVCFASTGMTCLCSQCRAVWPGKGASGADYRGYCVRCGYKKRYHRNGSSFICGSFIEPPRRSTSLVRGKLHTETRFVIWMIFALCRLIKNTATVSWQGHNTLISWLFDSGERSCADGWRALAALGYVGLCSITIAVLIFGGAALL